MPEDSDSVQRSGQKPPIQEEPLWRNWLTLLGMLVAIVSVILLLTFGLFSLVSPASNPYVDIIGYLVLPGGLVVGVALMLAGIFARSWRLRRVDPTRRLVVRFPRINLNDPDQRKVAKVGVALIFMLMPVLGVSGYYGYHYTDSADFCANACHSVMKPEAVTYADSAHARVACAECHIGAGASWFVRSKLSGTRQVFAALLNTYNRPIPTAIEHLRPARDTCEQCHWPEKFFGSQLRSRTHFGYEQDNPRRDVHLLVKTGGTDRRTGRAEGIHLHMLQLADMHYVATDDKLQVIPWVKWTSTNGETVIYRSDGLSGDDPRPDGEERHMDCMDCHNRPAHKFLPPDRAVDERMATGRIDPALPYIKREAVAALRGGFRDYPVADADIASHLTEFYQNDYPQVYETQRVGIRRAIEEIQQIYRETIFPHMRVDWSTYPDNIGHLNTPGCFRCHDGKHVSDSGKVIHTECNKCHTFLNQEKGKDGETVLQQGQFIHSFPLEGKHAAIRCDQCHARDTGLTPSCEGCHVDVPSLYYATNPLLKRFDAEPDPMAGSVECQDCHDLSTPLSLDSMNSVCIDCHDDPEYDGMLTEWNNTIAVKRSAVRVAIQKIRTRLADPATPTAGRLGNWLRTNEPVLELLSDVKALHNHAAAIQILDTLSQEADALIGADNNATTSTQ